MLLGGDAIDRAIANVLQEVPDEHDHVEIEVTTIAGGVAGVVTVRKALDKSWNIQADAIAELRVNAPDDFGVRLKLSKRL